MESGKFYNMLDHFILVDDFSKRGTAVKYIKFRDENFRLNDTQKEILKSICQGYFFYSKMKKMWGFTHKGNNEVHVFNYLKDGIIPDNITKQNITRNIEIKKEPIPFNIKEYEIKFIELNGRPLFYFDNVDGIIEININLKHWFFKNKDESEIEFAKKIVISLVGTELEYTSSLIDTFFNKLNSIQENLKYDYDKLK